MTARHKRAEQFYTENHSRTGLEPWMTEHFLKPLARRIPHSVHPNSITVLNHLVVWCVFGAAAAAPYLAPRYALAARILAAVLIFVSQSLDCLDGIHARLSGQTSRMGEVLDHWLDAANVPLFTAAIILTLGLDPLTTAVALVLGFAPYNGQLVLYHESGRFVHPTTSGYDGQFGLMAALIGFGLLFHYFGFATPWVRMAVNVFAWTGVLVAVSCIRFYLLRLPGRTMLPHLWFLAFCALAASLYVMGYLQSQAFVFLAVAISFRLSGSYVLFTVLGRRYEGVDWSIPVGLVMLAAVGVFHRFVEGYSYRGYDLADALPYTLVLYLAVRNVTDLARHAAELRNPEPATAQDSSQAK